MRDAVQAAARIPVEIFDLHKRNVREKHDAEDVYVGIAAEMAIREYLDKDDAAALEDRLRERVGSIGASTPKTKKLIADSDNTEKKKAQWRIRSELKEELKIYAKENGNTYSDVFALAIREYWTNSRFDRIEQLVGRLETAIEPWEDQIESDGVNVTVVDKRTAEIAMELGDDMAFSRSELENAIAEVTSDSEYNRDKYTPLVAEYKSVEEHPENPDVFIPHEEAEEFREDMGVDESGPSIFEQSFDELTSYERVLRVRARGFIVAANANDGKASLKHDDIEREYDEEPGETTIYNLMDSAGEANGITCGEWHGTKQLRITAGEVDNDVIAAANSENDTSPRQSARSELDELDRAEVVR